MLSMLERCGAWATVLAICSIVGACAPGSSTTGVLPDELIVRIGHPPRTLLDAAQEVPRSAADRRKRLSELFALAGCLSGQISPGNNASNGAVICTLPGRSTETIVVSAGYARREDGSAPDEWTSAALLPSIYRALSSIERQHTYVFYTFNQALFDVRELRPVPYPSRALNDVAPGRIVAAVGIQKIQFNRSGAWRAGADHDLYWDFVSVGKALELPIARIQFKDRIRSGRRTPSIITGIVDHWIGDYIDSFRLLTAYLGYLDQSVEIRRTAGQ